MFLRIADRYLSEQPDTSLVLHPQALADPINLMVAARHSTKERKYLE